jgi:hypothetical protein
MKPTEEQIKQIAEEMDCGMRCFFNIKTGEVKTVLNPDDCYDDVDGFWAKELEEIENDGDNYYEFFSPESRDSFNIMAEFTSSVKDPSLQSKLAASLRGPKPFRNFKAMVDQAGKYRDEWFAFKNRWYIEWVKAQIENDDYFKG